MTTAAKNAVVDDVRLVVDDADGAWWAGYRRGLEDGVAHGFSRGVDWSNASWTLTTAAACRAGLAFMADAERLHARRGVVHSLRCRLADLEQRRKCDGRCHQPLTPDEIRRRAAVSWEEAI